MSNCSNCYNGCLEIVSDKCVKYTGIDVPILGIKTGDSLSYVEQALVTFLTSTLNGSGIKINIAPELYCDLVSQYLQECQDVTALDLFKALVQAACNLQGQINTINSTLTTLNADYVIGCLSGVTVSSDTHAIVQAIITKLCQIDVTLTNLAIDIPNTYVPISEINNYIQAYLDSIVTSNRYYNRMIPFTAVEYYGDLSPFDLTGAGIPGTEWEKIYLCNGLNGTPDKRGRVPVGAIAGVPGGALDAAVNPASSPFNPNYTISGGGSVAGANSVILDITQIPSHNHTVNFNDPGHNHDITVTTSGSDAPNGVPAYPVTNSTSGDGGSTQVNPVGMNGTSTETTGITVSNNPVGGDLPHSNIQPVRACYYIMYIP